MAVGLKRTQRDYLAAENRPRIMPAREGTAQYEASLDGMEPVVQLMGEVEEEKLAPNYTDWLAAHSIP